jgi:spore coat assemly protein
VCTIDFGGEGMNINVGDIVERASYKYDLLFRVVELKQNGDEVIAILYGDDFRLIADAPLSDLRVIIESEYRERGKRSSVQIEQNYKLFKKEALEQKEKRKYEATNGFRTEVNLFQIPGRVLHIDGDPLYLKKCIEMYNKMGVPVEGIYCKETELPTKIGYYLDHYRPDILVITGHDAYTKAKGLVTDIDAYRHSRYFVDAVKEARRKVPSLDHLVIFAGACQSHFEAIIRAGANFASSPTRVNIHALDPVYVVGKISFTSFMDRVNVYEVVRNTITGEKGLGGIETKGILRTGLPFQSMDE